MFWKKKQKYVVDTLTKDKAGTRLDVGDIVIVSYMHELVYGIYRKRNDFGFLEIDILVDNEIIEKVSFLRIQTLKAAPIQIPFLVKKKLLKINDEK